ncbi:MAG: hypothetical protein MSC45_07070 [Mobiluncus sp.]|uniref:hypothetical protein n=1 Tax=Mobiluncus sp. TaxID=47293 RepID=UPI002587AF9E|nr:hypothetical protein [Mobiluncus sp.]MCI6584811.1 hypothetical protein [Mobiluncus sp.]
MDAGLVNGLSSMVASTLPKSSMSSAKDSASAVSTVSTPVIDTVEISSQTQSAAKVFDPTAVDGSYEQKHIGGALATSSAKDGFNGWEAMLKDMFGIENGGDRNDMPVIYRFNPYDQSPDGRGPGAGYVLANQLTNQERNFIANVYVYAHDNGLDTDIARTVGGGILNKTLASDNDAYSVAENAFAKGLHVYALNRPSYSLDNEEQAEIDSVVLETLSSNAIKDSLITAEVRDELFASRPGDTGTLDRMRGIQQLIYAYSEKYSDGSASSDGVSSSEAKRYISWRENMVKGWDAWEDIRASDPQSFEATGDPDAPNAKTNQVLLDLFGKDSSENLSVFDKYAQRVDYVASSLNDDQKSTLGMLYKLAEGKDSKAALAKVDQLAGAMAAMNYMNKMNSEASGDASDFWSEMMVRNRDEATSALREAISKRLDAAKINADKPNAATPNAPTHIDTEA